MEKSYFYLIARLLLDRNMVNLIANIIFPVLDLCTVGSFVKPFVRL